MQAAWVVPQASDVQSTYGSIFAPQDSNDFDAVGAAGTWLPIIVNQIRGAIGEANRIALSLTAGSIPPEAMVHCLALVAEQVIVNTPRLVGYIVVEGENGPLSRAITAARTFVQACRTGLNVTAPTDPDPNNLPTGVIWGDASGIGTSATVRTPMGIDDPPY